LGEFILFADADGSTDIAALRNFEDLIRSLEIKDFLICGSRSSPKTTRVNVSNWVILEF
jgi:hypothetical protein